MVFVSLAPVPPDENPFTVWSGRLTTFAYGETPTAGLKVRLGILIGIMALAIFAAATLIGVYCLANCRSPGDGQLWLMRVRLALPICMIITLGVSLAYILEAYGIYGHGNLTNVLWLLCTWPILAGGWWFSFATSTAFFLMPDTRRATSVTPCRVNAFFIIIGIVLCAGHLGMVTYAWIVFKTVATNYALAISELAVMGADWTAGRDTALALSLFRTGTFATLEGAYTSYQVLVSAAFGYLAVVSGFVWLTNILVQQINLGYVALFLTLRRQIFAKVGAIEHHTWSAALNTPALGGGHFGSADDTTSTTAPPTAAAGCMPSRSAIRAMASEEEDFGPRGENARQIQTMQRAERDLLVGAILISQVAGGSTLFCTAMSILNGKLMFFSQRWWM
ncbi:hypothetical protein RQP46_001336 [Phenoliferia psychrophenolica]